MNSSLLKNRTPLRRAGCHSKVEGRRDSQGLEGSLHVPERHGRFRPRFQKSHRSLNTRKPCPIHHSPRPIHPNDPILVQKLWDNHLKLTMQPHQYFPYALLRVQCQASHLVLTSPNNSDHNQVSSTPRPMNSNRPSLQKCHMLWIPSWVVVHLMNDNRPRSIVIQRLKTACKVHTNQVHP